MGFSLNSVKDQMEGMARMSKEKIMMLGLSYITLVSHGNHMHTT